METKQSVKSQIGEIRFREKLYEQQVEGKNVIGDEYDAAGIESILLERMRKTHARMKLLKEKGVTISPYIEIGAERCQRSLVMANDMNASGAALDISFQMLKSCGYYAEKMKNNALPNRVCCDCYNLPLAASSLPFAFCYETLHHFPDPAPIINEIYRVLKPGGHFFFSEEPYKKLLHLGLYSGSKIYSKKSLGRGRLRKILDFFFSKSICNETDYGIIENHNIRLSDWRKMLDMFERKEIELLSVKSIRSELCKPRNIIKYFIAALFGGELSGVCRKEGIFESVKPITETFICLECKKAGEETVLENRDSYYLCPVCGSKYPLRDGVLFLFERGKLNELYPEIKI